MKEIVMLVEKRILKKLSKSINYWKPKYHCHHTANSIFDLKFNMVNETSLVFQNGSNNDCILL